MIRIEAAPTTPIMKRAVKRPIVPIIPHDSLLEKRDKKGDWDLAAKKMKICKIIGLVTFFLEISPQATDFYAFFYILSYFWIF